MNKSSIFTWSKNASTSPPLSVLEFVLHTDPSPIKLNN